MAVPMSVTGKVIVALTVLVVTVGLCVFLPAWSLRYWQGWVFLVIFAIGFSLITVYFVRRDPALVERRLKVGPRAEGELRQKIIQSFLSLLFFASIVFSATDHRLGWSSIRPYMVFSGDGLWVASAVIMFFVLKQNSYASRVIEVREGQPVISTGPYGIVRHPMYAGGLAGMAGVPLALGSLWGLLVCVPMSALIVRRMLDEEKYLTANLAGYAEYRVKTRWRLIPVVY